MSAINGTTIILKEDTSGTLTAVAMMKDTTLKIDQDLPDSTNKDSAGWAEHIHGVRKWSIDVSGDADFSSTGNVGVLSDMILSRSDVGIEFAPSTTGYTKFTGTASLASFQVGSPSEGVAPVSGSLTGSGELTKATVS